MLAILEKITFMYERGYGTMYERGYGTMYERGYGTM